MDKKIKKIFFLFFLISYFTSCDTEHKSVRITDFSKPVKDSLIVNSTKKGFSTYRIEVKGEANDTCLIYPYDVRFAYKLVGIIDTAFISDYYGGHNLYINFEPFKATRGQLDIVLKAL